MYHFYNVLCIQIFTFATILLRDVTIPILYAQRRIYVLSMNKPYYIHIVCLKTHLHFIEIINRIYIIQIQLNNPVSHVYFYFSN